LAKSRNTKSTGFLAKTGKFIEINNQNLKKEKVTYKCINTDGKEEKKKSS
jgi:hypothetical protein